MEQLKSLGKDLMSYYKNKKHNWFREAEQKPKGP